MQTEILKGIQHLAAADPVMNQIMFSHQYQCPLGSQGKSIYELFIGAIVGQKISFMQARNIRRNLYTNLKEITPANLANTSDQNLRSFGISDQKIGIVRQFHNWYIANLQGNPESAFTPDQLRTFCQGCLQLVGIGQWTVNNVLIMSGLNLDIFLTGDKFISKKIQQWYPGQNVNDLQLKWAPYRSIATWFLWRP